jgi:hypothetical protein
VARILPTYSAFRKRSAPFFGLKSPIAQPYYRRQQDGRFLIDPAGRSRFNGLIPMSARKFAADKLLWEMLGRWKRSSPELDRIQFLKTVPFFDQLSNRQLKRVFDIMFEFWMAKLR